VALNDRSSLGVGVGVCVDLTGGLGSDSARRLDSSRRDGELLGGSARLVRRTLCLGRGMSGYAQAVSEVCPCFGLHGIRHR